MSSTATMELDLYETMIDFLRANVTDPMNRSDPRWITVGFPEDTYTKPAISILEVAMTYRKPKSHGHQGTLEGYRYHIDIFVSRRSTATIVATKYSGMHLLTYLSSVTKDALEQDGRLYFHNNLGQKLTDFKLILANTPPYNEGADEYRKTIGVIIEVERPKT